METKGSRDKLQLVWASVFLMACAAYGFTTLMWAQPGSEAIPMAIAIAIGMVFSVFTVPFLLLFGAGGRKLMVTGRVLVCLQMLCLLSALAIAVLMMVASA